MWKRLHFNAALVSLYWFSLRFDKFYDRLKLLGEKK